MDDIIEISVKSVELSAIIEDENIDLTEIDLVETNETNENDQFSMELYLLIDNFVNRNALPIFEFGDVTTIQNYIL